MEFKDLIKTRRLQIGKTLEEIGKIVGVSKATVQRWESGEIKNVRRDKIASLAQALETTPAYLMGWNEEAPPLDLNEDATIAYGELMSMVNLLTDEEWQKVMDYVALLISARQNHVDQ